MAFAIFALILIASLVIAILSKRGAVSSDMGDVMTAGGSFGAFLVFFISVGEIYSIGTMIGTPGSIYANGATYGLWFICYILLPSGVWDSCPAQPPSATLSAGDITVKHCR